MAVVYLDDSGTHESSPIITMAGYFFAAAEWERFETTAKPFLKKQRVPVFHAKVFNKCKQPPFKGWNLPKQVGFADAWFSIAKQHALCGVTISLPKARYDQRRRELGKNHNVSAYGQCFNGVLISMMEDAEIWSLAKREGMTVILELGNKHNAGVREFFERVTKRKDIGPVLKSIGECAKEDCVAIQLADYLAFYSWHYATKCFETGKFDTMPSLLRLAKEKVRTIGQMGEDFAFTPYRGPPPDERRQRDGEG